MRKSSPGWASSTSATSTFSRFRLKRPLQLLQALLDVGLRFRLGDAVLVRGAAAAPPELLPPPGMGSPPVPPTPGTPRPGIPSEPRRSAIGFALDGPVIVCAWLTSLSVSEK